jgi:hypothetical protein
VAQCGVIAYSDIFLPTVNEHKSEMFKIKDAFGKIRLIQIEVPHSTLWLL